MNVVVSDFLTMSETVPINVVHVEHKVGWFRSLLVYTRRTKQVTVPSDHGIVIGNTMYVHPSVAYKLKQVVLDKE